MKDSRLLQQLLRKKEVSVNLNRSNLPRVLTTLDLTALGIGSTLGVGVYILAGFVSKEQAGPAVVLSFLIAAIASVFAGLCYAEFGARVPCAGSAYIYSYVTVGEFIALVIGWNLILEYVIGAASVSRGLSSYIDTLMDNVVKTAFRDTMPMNIDFLSPYPDFFAFAITLVFSIALAFGVKKSSTVNKVFTVINLSVVLFVIIAGAIKANPKNWQIKKEEIPSDKKAGEGGFFPFGMSGVLKGAATCFYGFIGFDCVATTGEEAKTPQKSIPIAIIVSLMIVFLAYFGVSTVMTMMLPYYLQDTDAPLPHVFREAGWYFVKWIVGVGAIFGLFASLMGALYPLPRIIYAMAADGLLFSFLGKVHPRFKTPFAGTIFAGLLTGFMALIFDVTQLEKMMSIGTLLAYSIVAACVLLLRYEVQQGDDKQLKCHATETEESMLQHVATVASQLMNLRKLKHPTHLTAKIVTWEVFLYCILCIAVTALLEHAGDNILSGEPLAVAGISIFACGLLFTLVSISLQPSSSKGLTFKVPLVPALPGVSILINIYLMMMLDIHTWIRFAVWISIGLVIYFIYGIRHSVEHQKALENATYYCEGVDNPGFNKNEEEISSKDVPS